MIVELEIQLRFGVGFIKTNEATHAMVLSKSIRVSVQRNKAFSIAVSNDGCIFWCPLTRGTAAREKGKRPVVLNAVRKAVNVPSSFGMYITPKTPVRRLRTIRHDEANTFSGCH